MTEHLYHFSKLFARFVYRFKDQINDFKIMMHGFETEGEYIEYYNIQLKDFHIKIIQNILKKFNVLEINVQILEKRIIFYNNQFITSISINK